MKRTLILFVAIAMVAAGVANGGDPGPRSFGLYFDDAGDGCYVQNGITAGIVAINAHMVIAGPDVNVEGFEVAFDLTGIDGVDLVWLGTTFAVAAVDIANEPNVVIAGFGLPVLPNSCDHAYLGDLQFLNLNTTTGYEILAGPVDYPSIPGHIAYVDNGDLFTLDFATDADGMGVDGNGWLMAGYGLCSINFEAAIPVENSTWSNVKAVYR